MAGWILIVGVFMIWVGVKARMTRSEERADELAALEWDTRTAYFWGYSGDAARQALADKVKEHRNWRNNIKFELENGAVLVGGLVILLIAAVLWMGEDPNHTLGLLWKKASEGAGYAGLAVFGIYYAYQLLKRLDKADKEIEWLNLMLENVKNHANAQYSALKAQLDMLQSD
jgi:hypothetical protein